MTQKVRFYDLEERKQPPGIWRKVFPRRRTTVGTSPDADVELPSNPLEFTDTPADQKARAECLRTLGTISHWNPKEYAGISAEFYCDVLGRLRIRSMQPTERSHVYVNRHPVGKKGVLLEDRKDAAVQTEVRIGKFKILYLGE